MTMLRRHLLLAALLGCGACYNGLGSTRGQASGDDAADDAVDDAADDAPADDGGPSSDTTDGGVPDGDPFDIPADEVELLPFHVRVANLSAVAGVTSDHPMFTEMFARRYQLGDHDYANGIAPDLRWSAQKMETWVVAIKPICDDPTFQARYPTLVTDPAPLVKAAFAREPVEDELQALADVQVGITDTATRHRMVCLAVLTSLEFVAR
jgi:hypothetical protein